MHGLFPSRLAAAGLLGEERLVDRYAGSCSFPRLFSVGGYSIGTVERGELRPSAGALARSSDKRGSGRLPGKQPS